MSPAVITIDRRRKFARRARDYMRVYRALHEGEAVVGAGELQEAVTKHRIDQLVKVAKTHRCALDTDMSFIVNA